MTLGDLSDVAQIAASAFSGIALVAIWYQLRHDRRSSELPLLLDLMARFESNHFLQCRLKYLEWIEAGAPGWYPPQAQAVLDYLDNIGIAYSQKLARREVIGALCGYWMTGYVLISPPVVALIEHEDGFHVFQNLFAANSAISMPIAADQFLVNELRYCRSLLGLSISDDPFVNAQDPTKLVD